MKQILLVFALLLITGCLGGVPPISTPTPEPNVDATPEPEHVVGEPDKEKIALDMVKNYKPKEECETTFSEYIKSIYGSINWNSFEQDDGSYGVVAVYKTGETIEIAGKEFVDFTAAAFVVELEAEEISTGYFEFDDPLIEDPTQAEDNAFSLMVLHAISC